MPPIYDDEFARSVRFRLAEDTDTPKLRQLVAELTASDAEVALACQYNYGHNSDYVWFDATFNTAATDFSTNEIEIFVAKRLEQKLGLDGHFMCQVIDPVGGYRVSDVYSVVVPSDVQYFRVFLPSNFDRAAAIGISADKLIGPNSECLVYWGNETEPYLEILLTNSFTKKKVGELEDAACKGIACELDLYGETLYCQRFNAAGDTLTGKSDPIVIPRDSSGELPGMEHAAS